MLRRTRRFTPHDATIQIGTQRSNQIAQRQRLRELRSGRTKWKAYFLVGVISLVFMVFLISGYALNSISSVTDMTIPERFRYYNITTLTHHESHGRVYMLEDGTQQFVLKLFPDQHTFKHSLYIQHIIEESPYGENITVQMIDYDDEGRWIRFEMGIHIRERHQIDKIHDLKQQLMSIHQALQSLGIIHHDVKTKNFLLSKDDLNRLLIFDFGNAIKWKDIYLLRNPHHISRIWDRARSVFRQKIPSFFEETRDFETVCRHF